jgi:hypothetical protein
VGRGQRRFSRVRRYFVFPSLKREVVPTAGPMIAGLMSVYNPKRKRGEFWEVAHVYRMRNGFGYSVSEEWFAG